MPRPQVRLTTKKKLSGRGLGLAETRKKEEEKEFQKGLIASMTNLADAVGDLTEVIKEDWKNLKVVGREVKVYYKDKGLCKGHVNSMSVEFEGEEGGYTVVDGPCSFLSLLDVACSGQKSLSFFYSRPIKRD